MTSGSAGEGGTEEERLERQMGCMTGFLQMFDRHHVLTGRRYCSTRHLPTTPNAASTPPSVGSEYLPTLSPESCVMKETPARRSTPLPLPVIDVKDGARISCWFRDAARLSLDSRAAVCAKGELRPQEIRTTLPVPCGDNSDASETAEEQGRSPSVIARLMGINALPSTIAEESDRAELRRSASEPRARRDPQYDRLIDKVTFHKPPPPPPSPESVLISANDLFETLNQGLLRPMESKETENQPKPSYSPLLQRKGYFYAYDFFPESKRTGKLYGEIERRLRMRGIEEPAKDLETLQQLLEALQLQGLLHSKPSDHRLNCRRNLIHDFQGMIHGHVPEGIPRWPSIIPSSVRPTATCQIPQAVRRGRPAVHRSTNVVKEKRNQTLVSPVHGKLLSAVAEKSSQPQRRTPAGGSPNQSPKRIGPDPSIAGSRSLPKVAAASKERVFVQVEDDTSTTNSGSSSSISSPLESRVPTMQRWKSENKSRNHVDRCDKVLLGVTACTGAQRVATADQQPSPVSVLESSPYLDEVCSPTPLTKRSIDLNDEIAECEEQFSPMSWANLGYNLDGPAVVGQDFAYARDVLRASRRYGNASDAVFEILEKRCCRDGATRAALPNRRLIFDTTVEILQRKHLSHPCGGGEDEVLRAVWTAVRRIREQMSAGDNDIDGCGAVPKYKVTERPDGWAQSADETSDAVLQIERLIFKDLVSETIRDLAESAGESRPQLRRRRKLAF